MSAWTPEPAICAKVIGLVSHRERFLASEVLDLDGALKGVRPLGGAIEFGETREGALRREFREEMGVEIDIIGDWRTFENIYRHGGALGHEFVFAAPVRLARPSLYEQEQIDFQEDDGLFYRARWFSLPDLRSRGVPVFPQGLAEALQTHAHA